MNRQKYIEAGKIVNTHGVRGEVKIQVWLDSPEFFRRFKRIFIGGRELRVLSSRTHKDCVIAVLEGVEDINAAMSLKNKTVAIDREDAQLGEGEYFLSDILGADVVTEDGSRIGTLEDIIEAPAQRVLVVRGETERLIPDVPQFVLKTDVENGKITVHLIDGM